MPAADAAEDVPQGAASAINPARHARLRLCVAPRRCAVPCGQGLSAPLSAAVRMVSGRGASPSPASRVFVRPPARIEQGAIGRLK